MEHNSSTLPQRGLRELLDETFRIYGRHFWRLLALVAVVLVPVTLISLILLAISGGNLVVRSVTDLARGFALLLVYGAGVTAVGQQYVAGSIEVRACYARAGWRTVSLLVLTAMAAAAVLVLQAALAVGGSLVVVAMVPAVTLAVYLSTALQTVIVEGRRAVGALARSTTLIRGSWWRVFRFTMLLSLVVFGLGIVVAVPFAVPSLVPGSDPASGVAGAFLSVGGLAVAVVIPPVVFIAGTLLYYDLRVRKEKYDLVTLSRELGMTTV